MIRERISLEVASASSALKNSWDMIEITARRLELYDSLLEIERLKADMGESRRFDLLEKEIERGEAAVALLNSRIRYLMAVSALEISIGADVDFLRKYFRERGEKG
jgi:outer membrane protein TolC